MRELVECVSNFSTCDSATAKGILSAFTSAQGVFLLDHSYDDYNDRLVVTAAGKGRTLVESIIKALQSWFLLAAWAGMQSA
jgi:glutamate formiminotransferase